MSEKEEKKIEMMKKEMEENMARMKKEFDNKMALMRFDAEKAMEKGREVVRERPLTYVGVAFGVGFIIGAILFKLLDKD